MTTTRTMIDRLDYFEGYLKFHRDKVIKDLSSLDPKMNNRFAKLINEAILMEVEHELDVIDDINRKTVGKMRKKK